jgi:hypothetical protein
MANNIQFNENTMVTSETFPSLVLLKQVFYTDDINNLLNIIKNRIVIAKRNNITFARILNPDITNFSHQIVLDVKALLRTRGYMITEIEDANLIPTGFKITFDI